MASRAILVTAAKPLSSFARLPYVNLDDPDDGAGVCNQIQRYWRQSVTSCVKLPVNFGSENQVRMVGHDHDSVQVVTIRVIVADALQHDVSSPIRKDSSILRDEGDEMLPVVTLEMRQVPAIERHSYVGADALVRPVRANVTRRASFLPA